MHLPFRSLDRSVVIAMCLGALVGMAPRARATMCELSEQLAMEVTSVEIDGKSQPVPAQLGTVINRPDGLPAVSVDVFDPDLNAFRFLELIQ